MSIHDRNSLRRLRRYASRLNRMLDDGTFETLSHRKRSRLLGRLRSLHGSLRGVISDVALRQILAAAAVLVLGLSACDERGGYDIDADLGTDTSAEIDMLETTDPALDPDLDPTADPALDPDLDPTADPDAIPDVLDDTPLTPSFAAAEENPFGLSPPSDMRIGIPKLADLDDDGDDDLILGTVEGPTSSTSVPHLRYYENTGSATSPAFGTGVIEPFGIATPARASAPALGDLDGDGDLDLIVTSSESSGFTVFVLYQENTGSATSPAFASPIRNPFGITDFAAIMLMPELADIDGDSDLDLFMGSFARSVAYLENTGSATSPAFAAYVANPFGITTISWCMFIDPAFTDLDRDGDLDLLVGMQEGDPYFFEYYENTGSATSASLAAPVRYPFGLTPVATPFPAFSDIDGDGDMDLFIGVYTGSSIYFFRNTSI